jgi:hypothetical protein
VIKEKSRIIGRMHRGLPWLILVLVSSACACSTWTSDSSSSQTWSSECLKVIVVICESLRESSVWCVDQVLSLQDVYRFESPQHSRLWVAACRCSHLVVCLVYCWWIQGVGYGYIQHYDIIMFIIFAYHWHWHGSTFCLFMLILVCRFKHSTWLN